MATFNLGLSTHGVYLAGPHQLGGDIGPSKSFGVFKVRDMQYGGVGTISGTVKVKGTPVDIPVARKVRLIREVDGVCFRETWSDPISGVYVFSDLALGIDYTALSYDYTQAFRAVVADRVVPE